MEKPQIVISGLDEGIHNKDLSKSIDRLENARSYQDLSTICIIPTRGMIHAKVVESWMGLMSPMNQQFVRMFVIKAEVGEAYNAAIETILANPFLSKFKYILTLEEDNVPKPDSLLKLYESIDTVKDGKTYDAVGALYWTKGETGQPMCYGNPNEFPMNFIPQIPNQDSLTECNGLGMGFTLFRMEMFKKIQPPFFKTEQSFQEGVGVKAYTQDLWFFQKAREQGFRFACDARVKVGHYDAGNDINW